MVTEESVKEMSHLLTMGLILGGELAVTLN